MLLRFNTVVYELYQDIYFMKFMAVAAGKGTKKRLPHWAGVDKFLELTLIKKPDKHQVFYVVISERLTAEN